MSAVSKLGGLVSALLCVCAAHADETVIAAADLRPSVDVTTSALPRFEGSEGIARVSRLDMTLKPGPRAPLGVMLGMSSISNVGPMLAPGISTPSFQFGLRWRYTLDSNYRFDITAYRRVSNTDAISLIESQDPSYGARVEMGMGSQHLRRGFVADNGFVGFQLEGGGRLGVKRKFGGPMIYYRNQF